MEIQIKNAGLTEYVHFLGEVSQDSLKLLAYHAIANVLMIDGSSRNNVFYEIMSIGSIIVGLDDGGLNDYITDRISGYLIKNEKDAANTIKNIMAHPE